MGEFGVRKLTRNLSQRNFDTPIRLPCLTCFSIVAPVIIDMHVCKLFEDCVVSPNNHLARRGAKFQMACPCFVNFTQ